MKSLFLILALIFAFSYAQTPSPKPIPSFDVNKLQGEWYVQVFWDFHNNTGAVIGCYTNTFNISGNKVNQSYFIDINGLNTTGSTPFTIESQNSIWSNDESDGEVAFIALDAISYKSFMLVNMKLNQGIIATRTPKANKKIISLYTTTAKVEKYTLAQYNTVYVDNQCGSRELLTNM